MKYIFILLLFTSCITINKYYPTIEKTIYQPREIEEYPKYTLPIYRGYTLPYIEAPFYKDTIINVHPIYIK